jgi:5'-3' exonuclease
MLVGDSTDGIKGAKGIGKVKATAILNGLTEEKDLYEAIENYYSCPEEILLNGQLLWIWREQGDVWQLPTFE